MRSFSWLKHALVGLVTVSTGVVGLIAAAPAASAAVSPVVPRAAAGVTADALPTVQIDGNAIVWAQVISGNTVYAGGQFSNTRPAGAAPGTNLTARGNLLAYDITTGNLVTSFAPSLDGTVKALAVSPDGKRLYVGGSFVTANGQARYRLAAYDTATGALVSSFAPTLNATVTAITATNSTVYVGGYFGTASGSNRTRLAAFQASNGALTTWAPTADYNVTSMVLSPDKTKVVVGGAFQNVNGAPVQGITALDVATGSTVPWPVNQVIHNGNDQAGTFSLSADSDTIYGTSYNYGTGNFEGQFAMNQDGSIKWLADCHGDTYAAFSPDNGIVYGSGHAHYCSNIGGFPDTNPRVHHFLTAFTKDATGTVLPNGQGGSGYGDFAGQPSPSLMNYFPTFSQANVSGANQAVWSLTGNKQYLAAGGEFPAVNGKTQQGLVRFAIPSLAPNKMGPVELGGVTNPTVTAIGGYGARVAWKLNWDYDDTNLTYKVIRADKPATPLFTTTLPSTFWQRPLTTFVDKTAQAGQTYRYKVVVNDPSGNGTQSDNVSVTMPTSSLSSYGKAVLDDGASNYWRLGDADQPTLTDLAGGNALTRSSGVTPGTDGAIGGDADTSATFDGTQNGVAGATTAAVSPDTFSAEAWIKTTTTSGGKILGFGNSSTGTSGSYDPHIYMDNGGHLTFGVYTGNTETISTGDAYNDGAWHHVVAEMSPAGMTFWVDGIQQGTNPTTAGQPYTGYWRVGGDNLGGWPYRGSNDDFAGQVDDVAIYPTALTVTQLRDHYTRSGRSIDLPSQPTDSYGQTVFADNPTLYWRLDDTAGPTIKDSGQNRQPGVASGGVTYGAPTTVTGASGTALTFDGNDGSLGSSKAFANPTVYSEEVWFNTTTNRGGKLIGFGSNQSGRSDHYDRHVYMEDGGQLTFGTYTGQLNTITSQQSYNDGTWHHMVATQGADGMKLYVDGVAVGSNPQTGAEGYTGYWRVGGDSDWGGTSAFLAGSIDEAAVYPVALTAAQVQAHYVASPAAKNTAPTASFTSGPCTDGACTFDASASSDPDGSIASFAWDFGDQKTATGPQAQHTYAAAGTYTVRLTVTDDRGAKASTTKDVTIGINQAPVASFTSSCAERACSFVGSASNDPDGSISGYAWSFGDGSTSTDVSPNHTYSADGTFTVTLTVTDDQGKTDQTTKQVTAKANQKPTAAFTSSCTNLACTFDAATSSDSDGKVVAYAWDFGDKATDSGPTTSHTYTAAGSYVVALTVTDDQGATATTTKTFTVSTANVKPTASFTSSCGTLACTFDATASSDSDGTVASFDWDFGDGTTGTGKTPSHSYASGGTYSVKLTVTDDRGATDTTTATVAPTGPAVVAADQFARTATKWGTADTGGTWTQSASGPFSTNGSTGVIKLSTAGASATASLDSVSSANTTLTADVSTDKAATGNGTYANLNARKSGSTFYTMKVRFMADGTLHLAAARTVSGSETTLKEVVVNGVTYTPGTVLRAKFVVTGSSTATLTGKVWAASGTEPTNPQITSTDSTSVLQAAGGVGISSYLSGSSTNAPVAVTFDNILAIKQ